jgi:hypothetical protein
MSVTDETTATTFEWRPVYWGRDASADAGAPVILELSVLEGGERLWFLEHVYDRVERRSTRELVARAGSMLYVSDDFGTTWREHRGPEDVLLSLCFTTATGTRLLQEVDAPHVHVFDSDWQYVGRRDAGLNPWHGTWSIDQSASGTIMFGEYAPSSGELHVHRSTDDGRSWDPVFMQPGHATEPAAGRIRHFHTCTADPFIAGRWYVSSGDRGDQNRLWCSDDDGSSWRLLSPELGDITGPPVPDGRLANVVRHTAEAVLADAVVWPTDDHLGSSARLVQLRKPELDRVDLIASFGRNELRNLVVLDDETFVVLSESKLDPTCAEAYVVRGDGGVEATFRIENPGGPASVARSRSSIAAVDGVFFSFSDLEFPGKPRLVRWTVRRGSVDVDADRSSLKARISADRQGPHPTPGRTALEAAYTRTFCCNVCSPELEAAVAAGDDHALQMLHDPRRFTDERRVEYPCPNCGSRIRQRSARILVATELENRSGRLLLVSTARPERLWFTQRYAHVTHMTLEGDFGDPQIKSGVDLRGMPEIPSASFDLMTASCVLDYIPELDAVAREAYRVLAPGGEFAFFIMPYRLIEGGSECVVKHRNALAHESYARRSTGETGVPSCEFGTEFVRRAFESAGFAIERVPVRDPLSGTSQAWWVATKPST